MQLDLTDEETLALLNLLTETIEEKATRFHRGSVCFAASS
jgi:hypothetical protein